MSTWQDRLAALKACSPGLRRIEQYETFQELWDVLDHGDWMMWTLAHGKGIDSDKFVACARACLVCIIEDCPVGGYVRARNETADGMAEQGRVELAYEVTAPYEHGPLAEKRKTWKRLADVVRSHFPEPPELPE